MATRFYLPSTGTGPFSPATGDGGWERDNAGVAHRIMDTVKLNSALTTLSYTFGATATSQTRYHTWTSRPLAAQQITGNASMVIGKCGETSTAGDAHLAFALRLVNINGVHISTVGTLMGTSTEFPLIASAATRIISGAVTNTRVHEGDRLIFELGIHGVTPANEVMQLRIGDPTGSDFALTAGLTTDLCPWWELSTTLYFQNGASMMPWFAP